ncbi:MAG TPA: hypothetical protein VFE47_23175 [Tepidisphaeraceae bacterium]|jgi:hypothetical protein|nr:hypothetical protein [Tepidisphaeraceae bacterium]
MNAIRFRKHLDGPIVEFPELTPMVGKEVEIIALEDSSVLTNGVDTSGMSALERYDAAHGGPPPFAKFEDLTNGWPEEDRNDGFEEWVDEIRQQPWTREVEE